MIEVAMASGFGSVRRFNETFQKMYGRAPSALRRRAAAVSPSPEITLLLPYRPPYDWESMIRFFAARAIEGVEVFSGTSAPRGYPASRGTRRASSSTRAIEGVGTVTNESYHRVIDFDGEVGSVHVSHAPEQSSLRITVRLPRLDLLPDDYCKVAAAVRSGRGADRDCGGSGERSDFGAAGDGAAGAARAGRLGRV